MEDWYPRGGTGERAGRAGGSYNSASGLGEWGGATVEARFLQDIGLKGEPPIQLTVQGRGEEGGNLEKRCSILQNLNSRDSEEY